MVGEVEIQQRREYHCIVEQRETQASKEKQNTYSAMESPLA